ncbi:uncharacterized protein YndB with AHSA1/START domain [Motilibacter peucedani]|uniref:Uncharacterized protein YndB with AHSA1/START domain n=1 Tax=Motilibacter peucedani TaxID=598650 RepID=A0A420XQ81_9ACTN|nr:SRPBCC family protein [Motilibacter peucedani]RKS75448.1 uncharacterized protein YndB with AHSA1/START domain [Motilibacter peucedani]
MSTEMATIRVERVINASREQVWSVLADGWAYANWVVGASAIRDVEAGWPAVGAQIHHSVGAWPVLLSDSTSVLECEPQTSLTMQARGWPLGEATISLTLEPLDGRTRVTMTEDATRGPGRFVPRPLRQAAIVPRNRESLRRLSLIAENRAPRD